jgi:methionyl-tRNA formyltransferase
VTYAAKISKAESAIDWSQDAAVIERKIRALNPAPGCTTELNGEIVKVWHGAVVDEKLQILELQRPGGKRMAMADYLRGLKKTD